VALQDSAGARIMDEDEDEEVDLDHCSPCEAVTESGSSITS
jgi:hypothetical protein